MSTLTKEEIFQLFGESQRQIEEVWRLFKESDRKFQEGVEEAKQREAERAEQAKQREAERAEQAKQREAERAEQAKQREAELDRKIKEMTQAIGQLGNRLGQFVEEMVKPAVVRLFQERGIPVHHVFPRATASYEDDAMEVDLLVVNAGHAILVEAKSELKVDDVKEHLDRLDRFKKLFPAFRDHQVMGAVAGMVVSEETARFAYRQGLFVLGQSGETMTLRNDAKFQPKLW